MKINNRPLNWFLAATVYSLCRLLFWTLRIRYVAENPNTNPFDPACKDGFIYCVWHDAIAYPMFAGRHVRTAALVSKNLDGSHLARGLRMLHITLVRGSSSRGGSGAIREILRLPQNTHLVVTPDGPRGPRHKTKPGVVFIAAHSGKSIIPTAFSAARSWKIPGSWTNLSIPKPFTTVYALSSSPIALGSDASAEQLEQAEVELQQAMDRLSAQANQLAGVSG